MVTNRDGGANQGSAVNQDRAVHQENTADQDGKRFASAVIDPIAFVEKAIIAVPAVRFALGVGGIGAIVAIVAGFRLDYRVAIFGTLIVFALMFLLVLFANLTKTAKKNLYGPTMFVTWAFLLMVIATTFFIMTCFFFKWPRSLDFEVPASTVSLTAVDENLRLADLPGASRILPDRTSSPANLAKAIRESPSLSLTRSTLDLEDVETSAVFVFSKLEIGQNSKIVLYNRDVTFVVDELVAGGGRIVAFDDMAPAIGGHGVDAAAIGQPGGSGGAAFSAGSVRLVVLGQIRGKLNVDLSGPAGGAGGRGAQGAVGRPGPAGANGQDQRGLLGGGGCLRGGSPGGSGARGQQGAPGGDGGRGGNGGNITILAMADAVVRNDLVSFESQGGKGGVPGFGGSGGVGGPGGPGGQRSRFCSGGPDGQRGDQGPPGQEGNRGEPGNEGQMTIERQELSRLADVL